MKTYLLDTNSILRFLLQDIPRQYKKTKEIIFQAKQNKIRVIIPGVVIPELIYALEKFYSFSKETTSEVILSVASSNYIGVENKEIYKLALSLYKKERIYFVDCFLLSYANEKSIELFTFDQKLQKLSKVSS